MSQWRAALSVVVLPLAVLSAATLGCGSGAVVETGTSPQRRADIDLSTAPAAATSLLMLLDENVQAIADHDRTRARAARDQVIWHVAARDEILKQHRRLVGGPLTPDEIMVNCVESWGALLAYYLDGVDADTLRLADGLAPGRAKVLVTARGQAGESANIEVLCTRNDDGEWQVRGVDFVGAETEQAAAATQPVLTTVPATSGDSTAP